MMNALLETAEFCTPFHYLRPDLPLLMVPVKINGRGPFEFILDTGNARYPFLLSPGLAREIGLETGDFSHASNYTVGIDPASRVGRIMSAEIAGITVPGPCIAISAALEQLQQSLAPTQPEHSIRIDGNIGYPFLKDYTLGIDFGRSLLTLTRGSSGHASLPVTIQEKDPLIVLPVFANEQPFQFVLDTGASGTCVSTECARTLGLEPGREIPLNMSGEAKGFVTRLPSLRVADKTVPDLTVVAADFLESLSNEVGTKIDGVLGHNFWGQFRLTIDYPASKIGL